MKKMMANVNFRRGFTLIELMIVIVILGVLMGTILPRLTGAQGRARDTGRIADLQQIAQALEIIANDNGGVYPANNSTDFCLDPARVATAGSVESKLAQMLKGKKLPTAGTNVTSGGCAAGKYYYKRVARNTVADTGYVLMSDVETFQMANAHWASNSAVTDQDNLTFLAATLPTEAKASAPTAAAPEGTGAVTVTNSVYIVQ